ncbi:MAG: HDIG domain-containing protein [Clostridia bacterium]|nr:HDIG domain-containing protein [Clostridia bacterium]
MIKSLFNNALHSAVTILSLMLIIFVVLFSHETSQVEISVGEASSQDVYATRNIVDKVTTEKHRKAAANSVEDVYMPNDNITNESFEKVNGFFAVAMALRNKKDQKVSVLAQQLKNESLLPITDTTAKTVLNASNSNFSTLRTIGDIVNKEMQNGIPDLEDGIEKCHSKISLLDINDEQKRAALDIVSVSLKENMEYNEEETMRRRSAAAKNVANIEYKKGQTIVSKGEIVSKAQYEMLLSLGLLKGSSPFSPSYTVGLVIMMIVSYLIIAFYNAKHKNKNTAVAPISALCALLIILMTFYGSKFIPEEFFAVLPVGLYPGIVTIFSTPQTAIITNIVLSVFCAVAFEASWSFTVCLILAGTLSAYCYSTIKRRSHLLPAAFVSSLLYGIIFCAMSLIESSGALSALYSLLKGFSGGFLSGLITIGSLPFFEWAFNATTPMRLSELANPENKLLKRLLVEAPGTYHHSLTVANISEIAARSIKADSLLARVGAYYHDIGKLRHPMYFKENQYQTNAHDNLTPQESSALIISHVSEGADIAVKNHLPQSICDIISQHHGRTTTGYFLIRARETDPNVDEAAFTYPGPVPQTKEAAIVMLADSCEAAVRSIDDKSEGKIEAMVRKIVTDRVNSGQFSECNLTFAELETVIKVITKTLGGYFHERIKYE